MQVHVSWMESGTAVFSFRGTESTQDGLQDLKLIRRNIDFLARSSPGAKAHTGAPLHQSDKLWRHRPHAFPWEWSHGRLPWSGTRLIALHALLGARRPELHLAGFLGSASCCYTCARPQHGLAVRGQALLGCSNALRV